MAAASASGASIPPALFAVRIVDLDVEYAKPVDGLDARASPLTNRRLRTVPVVRIFGGTPRGQKAVVHIHGIFRYFLVPFDGERSDRESLRQLAEELEAELRRCNDKLVGDHALIFDMAVERLLPFCGYHEERRPFLKVSVDARLVQAAAKLFCRGFVTAALASHTRRTFRTCSSSRSTTTCWGWTLPG